MTLAAQLSGAALGWTVALGVIGCFAFVLGIIFIAYWRGGPAVARRHAAQLLVTVGRELGATATAVDETELAVEVLPTSTGGLEALRERLRIVRGVLDAAWVERERLQRLTPKRLSKEQGLSALQWTVSRIGQELGLVRLQTALLSSPDGVVEAFDAVAGSTMERLRPAGDDGPGLFLPSPHPMFGQPPILPGGHRSREALAVLEDLSAEALGGVSPERAGTLVEDIRRTLAEVSYSVPDPLVTSLGANGIVDPSMVGTIGQGATGATAGGAHA